MLLLFGDFLCYFWRDATAQPLTIMYVASESGTRGGVHFQYAAEKDPGPEERKGNASASVRARRGVLDE